MELLLRLTAGDDRRLAGTVRRCDDGTVVAFSGSLELLACLERLCRDRPRTDRSTAEPPLTS